ncbi:MAG TPA: MFS transporter, partial [Thermoplasmataceae archaeon]|nr:MFS transporter [Thermoplasmataceae archaeon]
MDTTVDVNLETQPKNSTNALAKVTLAAGFGGFVEYFDFFIASFAAASVWPAVFFSGVHNASLASALSFASFGVVFLARPVGAFIFGQVADRAGRRTTLLLTMTAMGVGLLGIGLAPPYASIGVTSIALLFIFRLLFGIGIGGEFGGAVSWITETSKNSKWRPFWNLWATPVPLGLLAASLSFAALASFYKASFVTVGWRIPFVFGAALVVIGVVIRYKVAESPFMRDLIDRKAVEASPASQTLKLYWKKIILLAFAIGFMITLVSAIEVPFSVRYLATKGLPPVFLTYATSISFAFGIFTLMLGFVLGSRLGRRNMLVLGASWALVSVIIFFPLVNTMNHGLVIF